MEKLAKLIEKYPQYKSDKSEYLKLAIKEGNIVKSTGPHQVKLIGCEKATNRDYKTQKEIQGVNFLFEENGKQKKYFVPTFGKDGKFHYLIERFADIKEGTELILEYKREEGSVRGFIGVKEIKKEINVNDKEIPIIEEETSEESPEFEEETEEELEEEL